MYSFIALVLAAGILVFLPGCIDEQRMPRGDLLVGAYYYIWYPENFDDGYLRAELDPPQQPLLGEYDSNDPEISEQHIAWASQYGVDFFAMSWWPNRPAYSDIISDSFLAASNISDIKFCIVYEATDLGLNAALGATVFTRDTVIRMRKDFEELAGDFFAHPSYLRVDDRPVVIIYVSRTFTGQFREAIAAVRAAMTDRGYDIYLIGDEVFWQTTEVQPQGSTDVPCSTREPQTERIKLFDAITSYNMYHSIPELTGHAGNGAYMSYEAGEFAEFESASGDAAFVPSIMPGYNDRAVRLSSDNAPISRQWSKGNNGGTFFSTSFDEHVKPFIDPDLKMLLITSWNEWNEDSSIEPVAAAPATTRDRDGDQYTRGYSYEGYGMRYLELLRDEVVAVCGRIRDGNGNPLAGRTITATQDSKVCRTVSDSQGYYRFSRGNLQSGEWRLKGPAGGEGHMVSIWSERTITQVDFKE